ncbi:hypothetical protein BGZ46_008497 [Entomortierella lignicola]|nr:hypothetical protein BGZ46_008497 [Entomortierella lignicola]
MAASNMVNAIDGYLDPSVRQLNGKLGPDHRRAVYLCPIGGWSNNKIEKPEEKGKTESEPEAQAAHRSEPNEAVQDNPDDSGSEYSEDDGDLDIDEDEDGEYEPEENDQEEEGDEDADNNQFETDESDRDDDDDDEYLTDESEEEED